MIVGFGLDLVEIERMIKIVKRADDSFLRCVLSEQERNQYDQLQADHRRAEWLAGRFAVKEAAAKAIGTGFSNGITPDKLVIATDQLGRPQLWLPENILKQFATPIQTHVSITHTKQTAAAVVLIEVIDQPRIESKLRGEEYAIK